MKQSKIRNGIEKDERRMQTQAISQLPNAKTTTKIVCESCLWGGLRLRPLYWAKSRKFERAHLSESELSIHEKREKEGSRELEGVENSILSCSLPKQNRELGIIHRCKGRWRKGIDFLRNSDSTAGGGNSDDFRTFLLLAFSLRDYGNGGVMQSRRDGHTCTCRVHVNLGIYFYINNAFHGHV